MLKVQGYFKIPIKSYKFTSLIYYAHLFPEHFTVFLCPTIILLKFEDNSFIYTVDICDSCFVAFELAIIINVSKLRGIFFKVSI